MFFLCYCLVSVLVVDVAAAAIEFVVGVVPFVVVVIFVVVVDVVLAGPVDEVTAAVVDVL